MTAKPREWWIIYETALREDVREDISENIEGPDTGPDGVEVIEKSAYESLAAELARITERYRQIELANKEWTRNDAVTFGKLYERIAELEAELEVNDGNYHRLHLQRNNLMQERDALQSRLVELEKPIEATGVAAAMAGAKDGQLIVTVYNQMRTRLTVERDQLRSQLNNLQWSPKKETDCGQYVAMPIEREREYQSRLADSRIYAQNLADKLAAAKAEIFELKKQHEAVAQGWARTFVENMVAGELNKIAEKFKAENAELRAERDEANRYRDDVRTHVHELEDEVEKLRSALEYCFESVCKHEGEMHEGSDRKWCLQCSSWVYKNDWIQLALARAALEAKPEGEGE